AGTANATGIDYQASVAESHHARDVGMGTQNQRLRNSFRFFLDRLQRRHLDRTVRCYRLQPVDIVVGGRGVTEKHLNAKYLRRWHRAQPSEMPGNELRMGGPVPGTHLRRWPLGHPAIML